MTFDACDNFIYFSSEISMALWVPSHDFWGCPQGIEICTYNSKDKNINILITLNLAQDLVYFPQMMYIWSSQGFQNDHENLKIWNLWVGAKDTNINIWVTLKIAQNVIYFLQVIVNDVVKTFV